ncbi:indoleamine -dioxygenase [Colletotrichum incanum]|uniref:Indoleamine-dioxygenase n=1 Tax=Colletotrichum incanum TaxID=1573173 RepID=A0A161YDJ4_COLIC|nr:indoleamine -dioxygenase [Colletotrichum incanum]
MREYMPGSHRRFLSLFSDLPNLRDLVALSRGNKHHQELWEAYRQATRSLTGLRTKHLSIPNNQEELYGTGATLLILFLKQARDKTN